jgi:RNA polymerase sigma-70 factor (ECF subfamily)
LKRFEAYYYWKREPAAQKIHQLKTSVMNSNEHKVLTVADEHLAAAIWEDFHEALLFMAKGLCLRFAKDEKLTHELLHDLFLKVAAKPGKFREGIAQKGTAYLRTAMKHMLIDRHRALNTRRLQNIDEVPDYQIPNSTLYHLCAEELQQRLYESIEPVLRGEGSLPAMMLYIDGYSYKEIAAELGLPIGTVSSQINRAKKKLCDYYEDWDFKRLSRYKKRPKLFDKDTESQ